MPKITGSRLTFASEEFRIILQILRKEGYKLKVFMQILAVHRRKQRKFNWL